MNAIKECTKDCERSDCRISNGGMTGTCMAWYPTFDRDGNKVSVSDPNIITQAFWCNVCGKHWTARSHGGETVIIRHKEIVELA